MITSAIAQEAPRAGPATKPSAEKQDLTSAKEELMKVDAQIKGQEEKIATLSQSRQPDGTWWSTTNAMTMSTTVLVFGFLTLALAAYVIRKGHPWEAVLKIFGMVLIIVLTVFLIVAGYDDKQIAPAVGLLGTIAGYLLGKDISKSAPQQAANKGVQSGDG